MLLSCSSEYRRDESTVFRYNESSGIQTLDPAFARNQAIIWASNQLFNGLVELDENLQVQAAIGKDWSISEDGLLYRFSLRDDVFFHAHPIFGAGLSDPQTEKGRKVVADDFVYSFERLRSPETAAPGAWVLNNMDSIWSNGEHELIIRLSRPFPAFLSILSMKYCSVLPREVVENTDYDFRDHPIGTGPFYFKYWAENEKLIFRKNPFYFESSPEVEIPVLEAVSISFIPDKQSAFLEFIKGELDFLSGLDASYKDEILQADGTLARKYQDEFTMISIPYLNTEYLGILSPDELEEGHPLRIKEVRQAINYAFDRARMMRYLRNNIGIAANAGMIPPSLMKGVETDHYGYSRQSDSVFHLLEKAGYPKAEGLGSIKLLTNASYLDLCEFIQSELSEFGIKLEVEVVPPSTLRQMMATGKAAFFRASWIADYPDAENYLSLFYSKNKSPNGPNYTRFDNAQFDELYEASLKEVNALARQKLYGQMDGIVMSEATVVPLFYDQVLRFYPNHIEGLSANPMNLLDLRTVRKSRNIN